MFSSCFPSPNRLPKPEPIPGLKELLAKAKQTHREGGNVRSTATTNLCPSPSPNPSPNPNPNLNPDPNQFMEQHGDELVRAVADGELIDMLHLYDIFSAHPESAKHINHATVVQNNLPPVCPKGSLLNELRTSPVDLHPEVKESDGTFTRIINNLEFKNWGRTVKNTPEVTFLPHSKEAVCNIIKWSLQKGYVTVRASGYRHTWSDMYSVDGQVLIAMLPLKVTNKIPAPIPQIDPANDLMGIEMVGEVQEDGVTKGLCKIGAATTNEMFREWAVSNDGGWTVPMNVVMPNANPNPTLLNLTLIPAPALTLTLTLTLTRSLCRRSPGAAPTRPSATALACATRR